MVGRQHYSDYRLSAIRHYEKSVSFIYTCNHFHSKRQTLKRWYNTYKSSKSLIRKNRKEGAYKTTDNKVFKKYSLLIAINTKGVVGWKLYEKGAVNSERLKYFIAEYISANYDDKLLIMDNPGFHKIQDVKGEIQKKNKFLYTIPYYPRSNPIENFLTN